MILIRKYAKTPMELYFQVNVVVSEKGDTAGAIEGGEGQVCRKYFPQKMWSYLEGYMKSFLGLIPLFYIVFCYFRHLANIKWPIGG